MRPPQKRLSVTDSLSISDACRRVFCWVADRSFAEDLSEAVDRSSAAVKAADHILAAARNESGAFRSEAAEDRRAFDQAVAAESKPAALHSAWCYSSASLSPAEFPVMARILEATLLVTESRPLSPVGFALRHPCRVCRILSAAC